MAKINNALNDRKNRVDQYQQEINDKNGMINQLKNQLLTLNKNKAEIQKGIVPEGVRLSALESQLEICSSKNIDPISQIDGMKA